LYENVIKDKIIKLNSGIQEFFGKSEKKYELEIKNLNKFLDDKITENKMKFLG